MAVRALPCAVLALLAALGHPQAAAKPDDPFLPGRFDPVAAAARRADVKRYGRMRLMADARLLRAAAKIRTDGPLDAARATVLAQAYFSMRYGGCGGAGPAVDRGTSWGFPTKHGAAGRPGEEITVDKATGRTASKGFIAVACPRDFARFILPETSAGRIRRPIGAAPGP